MSSTINISEFSIEPKKRPKRGAYQHPDLEVKRHLVYLIESREMNVLQASQELQLKYSTAKFIYANYLKTGTLEKHLKKGNLQVNTEDSFLAKLASQVLAFKKERRSMLKAKYASQALGPD